MSRDSEEKIDGRFNPQRHEDYDAIKGKGVYTADNVRVGTIDLVLHPADDTLAPDAHYSLVKPGMLGQFTGQDEMDSSASAVQMLSEDRIILDTTTASIRDANWSKPCTANTYRRRLPAPRPI